MTKYRYYAWSDSPITVVPLIPFSGPLKDGIEFEALNVSDGYHTMQELYEHRYRLFLALVKIYDNYITPMNCQVKCWKSMKHDDGTMFPDSFILGMTCTRPHFEAGLPPIQFDISYHLPMRYWHLANVTTLEKAPPYDGYQSGDVLERLSRL